MAELTQHQQERIAKSSTDRLRSQLVCSGVDVGEVVQMDRGELKAAAAQIEAEKPGYVDARLQPLPDDGKELFLPPQVVAPRAQKYKVLKMKMELRKMELEAEARQAEAESRKLEAETRKVEAEVRKAEREAERETRKMELEMELKKIELQARIPGGEDESGTMGLEGTAAVAGDHSLTGRTKKFADALRHVLPHMPSEHAELPSSSTWSKSFSPYIRYLLTFRPNC